MANNRSIKRRQFSLNNDRENYQSDDSEPSKKNYWLPVLLAFIIGSLVGGGITSALNKNNQPNYPTVGVGGGPANSDASSFQLSLNNTFIEHGVLSANHLQAIYDGKDPSPTAQLLETNSAQIADLLTSAYGDQAKSDFLSMWRDHINEYVNYTQALKKNDSNAQNQSKQNLNNMSTMMGNYFNKLDSNITTEEIKTLVDEHVNLTLSIIDAYAAKDQATLINQMKAANDQASKFATVLAQRITASSKTD